MQQSVGFELSTQQERLWGSRPPGTLAASQCVVAAPAPITADAIRERLERASARYEVLRTAFSLPPGLRMPVQVVGASGVTWCGELRLAPEAHDTALAELLRSERLQAMAPQAGPLLRVAVVQIGDGRQLLSLTAAGMILDARSLELLAREILGVGDPATDDPLQYGDYSAWQQEQLGSRPAREPDVRGDFRLPLAQMPQTSPAGGLEEVPVPVADGPANALGALGDDPADVWLATWAALAARLTGRSDVVVAVESDGRAAQELAEALGPYARSLAVQIDVEADMTIADLVDQVARARSTGAEEQETRGARRPETLVGFSAPARDSGEEGLTVVAADEAHEPVQAQLRVRLGAPSADAVIRFDPSVTPREEADRIAAHLAKLVGEIGSAPGQGLETIDVLPAEERRRLVEDLSGSREAVAVEAPVHRRFEEQALRTPDAIAVRSGATSLTYAELDARANRVAARLRQRDSGPDRVVALLLDRSPELLVAVLGVLKSGAAYLPLHPDHPALRLAFQLRDAGAEVLLADSGNAARAAELPADTLRMDLDFDDAEVSDAPPAGDVDDVAYVIYTSGSTGEPKGVETTHRGLASYVAAITARLGIQGAGEGLRYALVTTMSTDLGNTSVFPALATGGCVDLVPVEQAMDGASYAAYFAGDPVDVLKITPSHLHALLDTGGADVLPRRLLVVGGEALPWPLAERVLTAGTCALVNHYGPTETTVGSLTYDVDPQGADQRLAGTVPIGRPLANTRVYVVDAARSPAPLGAPGELLIGGQGLARGYRGQPAQTAERFVDDPFAPGRVYRTGDVVRRLADGSVEFLRRVDGQVKIRGFRVEIGEIERVLAGRPGAARVAVSLREDTPGDQRLVAYVEGDADHAALRDHARSKLPDYMVPAAFVSLDALPLTPSGKLDRLALPAPVASGSRDYVAPRNEVEQQLAAIWGAVLGNGQVGVEDDFFELGGHSLLATQVIARIRAAFDIELPLHSLFTAPRIAALAVVVAGMAEAGEDEDDVAALLDELEGLTDEEAEELLGAESAKGFEL